MRPPATEAQKITGELQALCSRAQFPLKVLPVAKVKSAAEAGEGP